jgi:hypothetical protein
LAPIADFWAFIPVEMCTLLDASFAFIYIYYKYKSVLIDKSVVNYLHGAESFLRSCQYAYLVKKFPAFYGTQRFITMFTTAHHQFLS